MTQDKATTATSPSPDDTTGVLKDAIGAKEELRKQIMNLTWHGSAKGTHAISVDALDKILSLIDKYCETREVEYRKQLLKETNGIAGALVRFAERASKKEHRHWYFGIDENDLLTMYSEENGKYLHDAVKTTLESVKYALLKRGAETLEVVPHHPSQVHQKGNIENG